MVLMKEKTQHSFEYHRAMSRNLGWLTIHEQTKLSQKRVAIAGLGGVGGHYAETLARLGVCKFHLADFDEFEIHNFNRQNGSGMETLYLKKSDVIRERILDINPHAEITLFENGISKQNLDEFLTGIDLYLDGLDFFVLDVRRLLFKELHQKKIMAMTIAPVGMGASLIVFDPDASSFEKHFGLNPEDSPLEASVKFLVGLTPSLKQLKYLVDRQYSNLEKKQAPSLAVGPYLCAGVAGSEALRILLGRKKAKCAPWVLHFDAYLQTYTKTYVWMGHLNPMQRLKRIIIHHLLKNQNNNA